MYMRLVKCPTCNTEIRPCNVLKHTAKCTGVPLKKVLKRDNLLCIFCKSEKKNNKSLVKHEQLCASNPNRRLSHFKTPGYIASNQYIKAKKLKIEPPTVSEVTRKKLSDAIKGRSDIFRKDVGKKISRTIRAKVKAGTWHTSLAKHMHIKYNGVDLHGSWELAYAKWCDKNNISWRRNTKTFEYVFEGKLRNYTPDFYLLDTREYIEIKGFKTKKDEAKWSQFPKNEKLTILLEKELKTLKII